MIAASDKVVEDHYTKAELDGFDRVVRDEIKAHNTFIEQANGLKEHYQRKANQR